MALNPLRNVPSVGELLESPPLRKLVERISRNTVVTSVRTVLDELRAEVHTSASEMSLPSVSELAERIARRITERAPPRLRPVINATGILLDTALGRAPLAEEAVREIAAVAHDYASVELDLATGRPDRRMAAVEELLKELTGAEAALAVNNNAGATMLALAAVAVGREVIVSRGQIVDSGGFRLPEVVAASGAVLREVGTTNKTYPGDYDAAIGQQTAALMLVHPSDFAVVGSAAGVGLEDLLEIGRRHRLPVVHNVGSGTLIDFEQFGLSGQPVVKKSISAGADVVLFSGDELLGGPQCGIIAGRRGLIQTMEKHPMARALRVGKLTLAALGATLRLYRDPRQALRAIPLLRLASTSVENLRNRAQRLAPQLAAAAAVAEAEPVSGVSYLGGSAIPAREMPTWCVALKPEAIGVDRLAAALRTGTPAVVGRVEQDRLLLDLRTVMPRQDIHLVEALTALDSGEN